MEGRRRDGLISAAVDTLPLGPQRQEVLLYRPAVVTRKSSLSSTPHAPRHKKETAFIRALQQRPRVQNHPQKQYEQQLHVSKNHDRHDQFKSWSTSMLPNTAIKRSSMTRQAWATAGTSSSSSAKIRDKIEVHTKRVRPFRRTIEPLAPEGVPVLDLSCFNEPDHLMPPVELLPSSHRPHDTIRSDLSWGTAQVPSALSVRSLTEEENESVATICDEDIDGEEMKSTTTPRNHPTPPLTLQASKMHYVENKVLSHERGKSEEKLMAPIYHGMGDHGLIRRLRFGARILSQNGRDVHRELCGFMFLGDESMTIYEFRQFGQRLSALPLIPRAVYHHPVGRRCGEKYELRQIKKGTTLFFDTSRLTSLPESLSQRPFLAVRITDVDETAKWNLMTEGLKPIEYQRVKNYLYQSPSEESKRNSAMFQTLQGMLHTRLRGRACKTLVGLGRLLRSMAAGVGIISRVQLQQALRAFHISLTPEDYGQLWKLLSDDGRYADHEVGSTSECSSETRGGVYCDQVIAGLLGEMSEDRKFFVRKIFTKLDPSKSGSIQITNIHKYFIPSCHPDVLAGKMTPEEAHFALLSCLQPPSTQPSLRTETSTVPYADFDNYYEGVSMETVSDHDFIHLLQQCWSV